MASVAMEKEIANEKNKAIVEAIENDNIDKYVQDLSKFEVKEILRNFNNQKMIAICGTLENKTGEALLILEKKIFPTDTLELTTGFLNKSTEMIEVQHNDIYRKYNIFPMNNEFNGVTASLIHPATPKHIEKFREPDFYLIEETPELYKTVTMPLLSTILSLQWVENILNGTAEVENTIYNDLDKEVGFVLTKDSKWDGSLESLHLIAISRKPIKSLRDLNESHLRLLRNIKEAGSNIIYQKYNLPISKINIYIHYKPSYYHFHVHFTSLTIENSDTHCTRAHSLTSVIRNIEMMPDYYQKATIVFRACKYDDYKLYNTTSSSECPLQEAEQLKE